MEENENSFKSVSVTKTHKNSYFKSIILPFVSGIIGASLVVGTCFGIPKLREKILNENPNTNSTQNPIIQSQNSSGEINLQAVSLEGYSDTAMGVAEKVLPSIVGIEIEYNINSFFGTSTSTATGSGIIISEDGYILTNNHVVSASSGNSSYSYYEVTDAVSAKVTLYNDETKYDATIVGKDSQTDLAVIKIEKEGLTKATLGNSDSVKVGEFAMAVRMPSWIKHNSYIWNY